ncbi:MAG: KEOPS complex subunit Pcc1 [Methanosarcinaceae archaeon]
MNGLKFKAKFIFETDDACSIYQSILPELETPVSGKSIIKMRVSNSDSNLILTVEAEDVVSMRSTLNTWLRLIQVAHEISQTTGRT